MQEINENYFDNKPELTDEDIDQINDTIEEVASDSATVKTTEEAKKLQADYEPKLESAKTTLVTNPITGKPMLITEDKEEDEEDFLPSFEEMLADDSIKPMNIDMDTVIIKADTIKPILAATFPNTKFSDEDIEKVRVAAEKQKRKEDFSYYESMPDSVKGAINGMIGAQMQSKMGSFNKEGRNYIVQAMLDNIIQDEVVDKATYDMNKMIQKGMKDISEETKRDKYWEGSRAFFMSEIDNKIKKFEDEGKHEIAERFRQVKEAYRQSYTYENMLAAYKEGKIKVKKIQVEKFNRTCEEFNFKYQKTQNIINDIKTLLPKLDRVAAKHFDLDIIKEFIVIFINYVKNMDVNDYKDHTFMYYFIYNINTVDYYDTEDAAQEAHHKQIINNINTFLQAIVDRKAGK